MPNPSQIPDNICLYPVYSIQSLVCECYPEIKMVPDNVIPIIYCCCSLLRSLFPRQDPKLLSLLQLTNSFQAKAKLKHWPAIAACCLAATKRLFRYGSESHHQSPVRP